MEEEGEEQRKGADSEWRKEEEGGATEAGPAMMEEYLERGRGRREVGREGTE